MSQVGRISGPLLTANLERNGIDLAVRDTSGTTQLLYLDVNSGLIGINTATPAVPLDVNGLTKSTTVIATVGAEIADFNISGSTIQNLTGDINLNAKDAIQFSNLQTDEINISDNIIRTVNSDANIDLTPNGTGTVDADSVNVYGSVFTPGNITFDGNITFGNANTDSIDFNADIATSLIPKDSNTYNLGSPQKSFDEIFTNLINGQSVSASSITTGLIDLNLRHTGTLYVSVEGDNTNVGDHPLGPLETIKEALSRAEASGSQPVQIYVYPGVYQEELPLVVPENVSIVGSDIRNVVVTPDTSSQSEDVFHLNDSSIVTRITIKDFYYDSVNNTGYAFRFAPNAVMDQRSPYMQDVTVLTSETSPGDLDAGRGAWIDGSELNSSSPHATMLFHSCTFISPGADVINMTNGVRVEWLNSFTYFANRGLYAFNGVAGRTSIDGSTTIYGAELRSIGSANVYGTYGAVADGADTLMYLIQHNFAYIGAGSDKTNDLDLVVQANEVVELNSGQIQYVTTDQIGNFRIGDNFFVNFETGNTSLNIDTADIDTLSGLVINSPGGTTTIDGAFIDVGNLLLTDNTISTNIGDLNLKASTGTLNLNDNTNITGNLDIVNNFSFGGTLNIAGDQPGRDTANDRLVFNVEFEQNFNPHQHLTHSLGEVQRFWANSFLDRLEVGDIDFDGNLIATNISNADLELRANGTGEILIESNNVQVSNNLNLSSTINLQNTIITGDLEPTGGYNQTGNATVTNLTVTQDLDVTGVGQFEEILIDDNYITTTTSNTDLELRSNGPSDILFNNDVRILNNLIVEESITVTENLSVPNIFANRLFVNDIVVKDNRIFSLNSNSDIELRTSGTGDINLISFGAINADFNIIGNTNFQDSVTQQEYGPELITNGTFDSDLNGWSQSGGGTATSTNGNLIISSVGSARNVSQEITVVPGKTYNFEAQFINALNANAFYLRIFESGVGTLQEWNETSGLTANDILTYTFVPSTTAIDIIFRSVDNIVTWDNASVVEDLGILTTFTPVQVNIDDNITQTGNITQEGNITQTGIANINNTLTVSDNFSKSNILFDDNIIRNTGEGLRISNQNTDPNSLPNIVQAIVNGSTADDYAGQTEKNLINFLNNNNYVDVNQSGTLTTSDYIAYLQYVVNGQTADNLYDVFLKAVTDEIIVLEYATPGYFNNIIFAGDYYDPDLEFVANGTGVINIPNNNVVINQNLAAGSISFNEDIVVSQGLTGEEVIVRDNLRIRDNFITTTISNSNLELRAPATRNIDFLGSNLNIVNNVDANILTTNDLNVNSSITHTGNRNQTGNLNVVGNVTVSSTNINSEIQFENIVFNDNYLETTDSNSDLEILANSTGIISIPKNNTIIENNVSSLTANVNNININSALNIEDFTASSNIRLFDNVITTTESNSNLELRTQDTSSVKLSNVFFNNNIVSTNTSDINISSSSVVNILGNESIKIPTGTTNERQLENYGVRFNTSDNIFEGFYNNKVISFNGIFSSDRNTNVVADPTLNNINFNVNTAQAGSINSTKLSLNGIEVDDIAFQNNSISSINSNANLDLQTNGTGSLTLDDISLNSNVFNNNNNGSLELNNTLYGKVKFTGHSVRFPAGTTAQQPTNPETGTARWNTDSETLEVWDGSTFIIASGSAATISAEEMDDLILEYTLIFG